ncbi:hypothetical protein DDE82_003145 [Stemphylium lycopersici]|nr:hypothetical protein TW65_98115 [Stemphylium lycopersici]RAR06913.1 hypothetical protein DDE82_003145 [Stemphylium lycopersici]
MPTIIQTAGDMVGNVGHQVQHAAKSVEAQFEHTTSQILPHKRREQMVERARDYAHHNPRAAAFLTAQTALTGLPLVLFLAFAAATLLVSLTTCLFLGLLVSLALTFFVVSFALIFVVPTVVIASCSATFIFMWGLVGYIILRRFNEGEAPAKPGTRVGDKLQALTGGRSAYWQNDQAFPEGSRNGDMLGNGAGTDGRDAGYGGKHTDGTTSSGDGGPVKGSHGAVEWERKWADGVKPQAVVLDTENPYQALKVLTRWLPSRIKKYPHCFDEEAKWEFRMPNEAVVVSWDTTGHIFGFLHEHQRLDRDAHVRFDCTKVQGYDRAVANAGLIAQNSNNPLRSPLTESSPYRRSVRTIVSCGAFGRRQRSLDGSYF